MTKAQRAALERVAWGTKHFGALVTGRVTRKRDVIALFERGFVADAGMVAVCDGDGFLLQPQCYRQAWKITTKGKAALRRAPERMARRQHGRRT
jgi:hypothetical protein